MVSINSMVLEPLGSSPITFTILFLMAIRILWSFVTLALL